MRNTCLVLFPVLLATACSNPVDLAYTPTSSTLAVSPVPAVATVTVTDQRGESDPSWIGAIRGGFGNPLKTLHTTRPLTEIVGDEFKSALKARGLLSASAPAPFDVHVSIDDLKSDQVIRREANVSFKVQWIPQTGGQQAFTNTGKCDLVTGNIIALDTGLFSSPEDLRLVVEQAVGKAIDQALDDPALKAFLGASKGGTPLS